MQASYIVQPDNIPSDLTEIPQWIVWAAVPKKNGKVDKVPHSAKTGMKCDVTDADNYSTFDVAVACFNKEPMRFAGIGLSLAKSIQLTGIDLDNAFDEAGQLKPWALEIVQILPANTYVEVSPSGKGLRAFLRGVVPAGGRVKVTLPSGESIEMYDSKRFLTVTGNRWGLGNEVPHAQETIDAIHAKWFAQDTPLQSTKTKSDVQTIDVEVSQRDKDLALHALKFIPSEDREVWLNVGMAVKSAGFPREIWDDWAYGSEDVYDEADQAKIWASFKRGGITLGTLFHLAKQHGFQFPSGYSPLDPDRLLIPSELERLSQQICSLDANTRKRDLVALLEPSLEHLATINEAQALAFLREDVKQHFSLTSQELEPYVKRVKEKRKAANQTGQANPITAHQALIEYKTVGIQKAIHPAIDYVDGTMYFGVQVKDQLFVLTSNGEWLDAASLEAQSLRIHHNSVDYSFVSPDVVERVLNGESTGAMRLFFDIRNYIKRFVFLTDKRTLDLLAVWCMGTYVFPVFRHYPYLWLNADKGSGKTTVFEVLRPICFNGQMLVSPTPAVLFREVAANKVSLFIDEFERMTKQDKEVAGTLLEVLNAGYNKDGQVKRVEQNGKGAFKTQSYNAYSPKAFSGISNIDEVLRDRTIQVRMLRRGVRDKRERYKVTAEIESLQQNLRDRLYMFALSNAARIAQEYQGDAIERDYLSHLKNRELDLWEPLVAIMCVVNRDNEFGLMNPLLSLSADCLADKSDENLTDNDTTRILAGLSELLKSDVEYEKTQESGSVQRIYKAPDVVKFLQLQEGNMLEWGQTSVTSVLKKLGISTKRDKRFGSDKCTAYIFSVEEIRTLLETFSIL